MISNFPNPWLEINRKPAAPAPKRGYQIEAFKNGLGETRYRFAVPSILHPGKLQRSLRSWKTKEQARRVARREMAKQ